MMEPSYRQRILNPIALRQVDQVDKNMDPNPMLGIGNAKDDSPQTWKVQIVRPNPYIKATLDERVQSEKDLQKGVGVQFDSKEMNYGGSFLGDSWE